MEKMSISDVYSIGINKNGNIEKIYKNHRIIKFETEKECIKYIIENLPYGNYKIMISNYIIEDFIKKPYDESVLNSENNQISFNL